MQSWSQIHHQNETWISRKNIEKQSKNSQKTLKNSRKMIVNRTASQASSTCEIKRHRNSVRNVIAVGVQTEDFVVRIRGEGVGVHQFWSDFKVILWSTHGLWSSIAASSAPASFLICIKFTHFEYQNSLFSCNRSSFVMQNSLFQRQNAWF